MTQFGNNSFGMHVTLIYDYIKYQRSLVWCGNAWWHRQELKLEKTDSLSAVRRSFDLWLSQKLDKAQLLQQCTLQLLTLTATRT